MSKDPLLVLKAVGPGVGSGRIALSDLVGIGDAVQRAIRQIGVVAKTGRGSRGAISAEIDMLTRLELVGIQSGSARLQLDFPTEIQRPFNQLDLGRVAVDSFVTGISELNQSQSELPTPQDWDDGIFKSLLPATKVLSAGRVDSIEIELDGRKAPVRFSRSTAEKVIGRAKRKRSLEFTNITGRIMMVDFDIDRRKCRIESSAGQATACVFPIDLAETVRENARRFVNADGYAERWPDGKIKSFSILRLEPFATPAGGDVDPKPRTFEMLCREQGVGSQAVDGLVEPSLWADDDLDDFLAWLEEHRDSSLL